MRRRRPRPLPVRSGVRSSKSPASLINGSPQPGIAGTECRLTEKSSSFRRRLHGQETNRVRAPNPPRGVLATGPSGPPRVGAGLDVRRRRSARRSGSGCLQDAAAERTFGSRPCPDPGREARGFPRRPRNRDRDTDSHGPAGVRLYLGGCRTPGATLDAHVAQPGPAPPAVAAGKASARLPIHAIEWTRAEVVAGAPASAADGRGSRLAPCEGRPLARAHRPASCEIPQGGSTRRNPDGTRGRGLQWPFSRHRSTSI